MDVHALHCNAINVGAMQSRGIVYPLQPDLPVELILIMCL